MTYHGDQFDTDDQDEPSTEEAFEGALKEALEASDFDTLHLALDTRGIRTFEEVGMLTTNRGLVVTTADGREYQITIVDSTR
jgi:hypothetical protein